MLLVLAPGFPTADGPYTPHVVDTFSAIARRVAVTVEAIRPPPDRPGIHRYRGIDVVAHGGGSRAARLPRILRAVLEAPKPSAILSLWPDRTGPLAAALSKLLRAPLLVALIGGEIAAEPDHQYGAWRTPRSRAAVMIALAAADRIVVPSEWMRERLLLRLPRTADRIVRAPLGVPIDAITRRTRGPWELGEPLRLVAVSALEPIKRLELAARALEILRGQGIDATLEVFGAGAHAPSPRAGLKLCGFVPPSEIRARLADYHGLLHPSAHEAQGIALIEAAAAGLPIVARDVGVSGELAALGAAIVRPAGEDPLSLAEAVKRAAERSPSLDRPALEARFGIEAAAAGWLALLP